MQQLLFLFEMFQLTIMMLLFSRFMYYSKAKKAKIENCSLFSSAARLEPAELTV